MSRREWQYLVILFVSIVIVFSLIISVLPTPSPAVSVPTLMVLPPEPASVADLPADTPPSLSEDVSVAAESPTEAAPEVMAVAPVEPLPVAFAPTNVPVPTDVPTTPPTEVVSNTPTVPVPPTLPQPTNTQQFGSFQWVATPVSVPVYVPPADPVPGQVVVQFAPQASAEERAAYIESIGGTVTEEIAALDAVVVTVTDTTAAAELPPSPVVAQAEPDYYISAQFSIPPNDPLYGDQWALQAINAPQAWAAMPADAPRVPVAVIDSGICAGHPDLAGRILPGYDFVQDDADPQDEFGHGCAVSGIIAANPDDGIGIAGAAPNAMIMPLRVLDGSGMGLYSDVAAAITYAADNGTQVINLSLGGAARSSVLEAAIDYAIARGVTVVAAAGNTGGAILFPAAYEPVISVGAVDQNLQLASFSAHGADVLAPGVAIQTTDRAGAWAAKNGTSFAAPYVAAALSSNVDASRIIGSLLNMGTDTVVSVPTAIPVQTLTNTPSAITTAVEVDFQTVVQVPDEFHSSVQALIDVQSQQVSASNRFYVTAFRESNDGLWARLVVVPAEIVETGWENFTFDSMTEILAHRSALEAEWTATSYEQLDLQAAAAEVPPDFIDFSGALNAQGTQYQFPWPSGYTWWKNGGQHTGYYGLNNYAIDFQAWTRDSSGAAVLAAAGGTLDVICGPDSSNQVWYAIRNSEGSSGYGHLDAGTARRDLEGRTVVQGQFLAVAYSLGANYNTPCGYGAPAHIHFVFPNTNIDMYSTADNENRWVPYSEIARNDGIGVIYYRSINNRVDNVSACSGPSLSSPNNGATLTSSTVTFSWNALSGCTFSGYTFRVNDSSNMDDSPIIDTGEGGTSRTETIASTWHNRDLWWGVRAANAPGGASWSVRQFRVEPAAACSGPSLTSPSNGAVLTSSTATFSWNALSGCTFSGYTFRVNDSSNMDDTPIVDTGVGGTSRTETISSTWHNRDLWWGVRAANASAGASWSVRQFRVEPVVACSGPSLTSPSNGAVLTSSTVTFSWSALSGCTFSGYTFRVNDSSNMDDTPIVDTGVGGTSRTETIASTWHNRDLWWGVRAANSPAGASWSVRQFRVEPDTTPPQVQFTNPSAARWYNSNSIQLSVTASDSGSGMNFVEFFVGYDPQASGAALALSFDAPPMPEPATALEVGTTPDPDQVGAQTWDWVWIGNDSNGADGWSMIWDSSSIPEQGSVAFYVYAHDNADNYIGADVRGNGLDRTAPVTTMNALPQYSPATFTVSWIGIDNLSGVDDYDLEVSTNGGSWTSVVTGWTQSSYQFSGQVGLRYSFRVRATDLAGNVEAFYPAPGAEATVQVIAPPANDTSANATVVTGIPTFIEQSVIGAGAAGDPPLCDAVGWQNQHVVWFRYTPTANVTLNVATTGTAFDTVIALFNGTPSAGTRNGLCDDQSGRGDTSVLYRSLQANQTYYIGVGLVGSTPLAEDIPLKVQFLSRPSNDWWIGSSPVNLGSLPTTYSMNVIGATPDDELNLCDPVPSYQNTVWFTFTPSAADTVTVSTDGSNYDTVLAVYAGDPQSGTKVGCHDDVQQAVIRTSELVFPVVQGTTYYVGVAAWGDFPLDVVGDLHLSIMGEVTPTFTDTWTPTNTATRTPTSTPTNTATRTPTSSATPIPTLPTNTNLIVNGDFTGGYTGWLGYHWNPIAINGGVMEFSLPQGQPYGVLWQQINRGLASGTPLELSFDLQNTSSAPRTLQVYLRDQDWGTARQCNFTLPANMPMRRFTMQALTGSNWGSILAQWWWMNGDGGPVVRIDNIDLRQPSPATFTGTTCSGLQASANENLIANGDFSQGYANWLGYHWNPVGITNGAFTFGLPNGQPWGVLWQEGSTGVPNGAPLELSFQLANSASVSRSFAVYLRATDWNTLQRCDFTVPANLPMTTYRMRIRTGAAFDRVFTQFWLLNGDGQPPMQIDDIVLRYRPELAVTSLECNGAITSPTVGNLIQNPSFNGGFANWWGIGLTPVYVQNAMMSFDIPAGQAYGTLWQEVSVPVTAGTPLELSFNLGNTGSIAQTVRVFLRDLDWGTARTCSFTLPANAAMRTYSMRAAPGTNWGRILAQWWLDNGDGSPAITIDDVSLYTRPGTSTALECSAPLALEVEPLSVSPTGDGTTAPSGPALIPTATASPTTYTIPTATPTSGLIPTASLMPTGPSLPTLIPTATATVLPPTAVPSATATTLPPTETPLPPTDVPIPTATDVPSATPLPPTDIPTEVPPPTDVQTAVPTDVPPPPTEVPTDVPPPPPTDVPTDVPPPVEPLPTDPGAAPPIEGGA